MCLVSNLIIGMRLGIGYWVILSVFDNLFIDPLKVCTDIRV